MQPSDAVRDGLRRFYASFSSHDAEAFAAAIAECEGVSVTGSAPVEGHHDRESWIAAYRELIPQIGLKLEGGPTPVAFAEGKVGFVRDEPRFVLPDGSFLPTRLTGVLHQEDSAWKVVHLHFSVGVPDEHAIQPAASDGTDEIPAVTGE